MKRVLKGKDKYEGRENFENPNIHHATSSSGTLHMQILLPRKLPPSALLFVSYPGILLRFLLFGLQCQLRYDFLEEDLLYGLLEYCTSQTL